MTEINFTRKEEKEVLFKALLGSPFFNILASVLATFIVGTVFFRYGGGVPIQVTQTSTEKLSSFEVSGEGKIVVVPDEARVVMGVRTTGRSIASIQEEVNSTMKKLGERLKGLGIDEKEIKTTAYSVYPDYQDEGGYQADAQVEVRIKDLAVVSQVMDLTGELGLERVGGVSFELSDQLQKETVKEAREQAIEEAKQKAEELAKLAGMRLGRIVNVQEGNSYPQPYMMSEASYDMAGGLGKTATPIEVGSNEVTVTVTLSYETL